jgi:hypothetical protein
MDEEHINQDLLIERYLQGKLSDKEAASFEEQFLSSDELLDELESAELLQQGLQDVDALEKAYVPDAGHIPEKPVSSIASLFHSPRYAMAASFLLLFSVGFSGFLVQQNTRFSDIGPGQALPTEIIPMVSVRSAPGSEPVNTLQLSDSAHQFVLMLDPGYEDYSRYRATIFRLDPASEAALVWQVNDMLPGYEDMLALSVPGSVLSQGDFEIHLEGWKDEWSDDHRFSPIETIHFKSINK